MLYINIPGEMVIQEEVEASLMSSCALGLDWVPAHEGWSMSETETPGAVTRYHQLPPYFRSLSSFACHKLPRRFPTFVAWGEPEAFGLLPQKGPLHSRAIRSSAGSPARFARAHSFHTCVRRKHRDLEQLGWVDRWRRLSQVGHHSHH